MAKKNKSNIPNDIPTMVLSEVAMITKGPSVKNEEGKGVKKVNIITLSDLPNTVFIESASKEVKLKEKLPNIKMFLLEPFDVLFSAVGNFDKVGIFPADMKGNWVSHRSIFRIRFNENQKDNAIALAVFLKSSSGKKVLESIQIGKRIKSISKKALSDIEIPELTPDINKQARTAFNKEIKLIQKIDELNISLEQIRAAYLQPTEK